MHRSMLARWVTLLTLLGATPAAAVPQAMNVQGVLRTPGGQTVDGSYDLTFSFYAAPSGGAALWSETIAAVQVSGGLFSALISNGLAPQVFANNPSLWLGIRVDADPELPRERIATRGYAFAAMHAATAATADTATTAQGLSCSGCVNAALIADGSIGGDRFATGSVTGAHIVDGGVGPGDVSFAYAGGTAQGGAATNVACVGCVGAGEVDFPYAASATAGGAASDLGCAGCVSMGELAFAAATTADMNAAIAALPIPQVTLESLQCGANQVPRFDGAAWGCADLIAGGVPTGKCDGGFQVLQWTGSAWTCADVLTTGKSNGHAKGFEAYDSWGYTWDGLERQAATWAAADAACKAKGGRLPTMTELFRVSGAGLSEVGNTYETNYLWAITQWDPGQHGRVRLTDGATQGQTDITNSAYRCVWPNNTAAWFKGNHCYGPPGNECFTTNEAGKRRVMDKYDRPPVTNVAAHAECAFYHAHLATQLDFAANVPAGLPNGTNTWLWTSDASRYDIVDAAKWTGTDLGFDGYSGAYVTWYGEAGNVTRFRCIGVGYDAGAHPNAVANGFLVAAVNLIVESFDKGLTKYAPAVSECFGNGGHLATERDLIEAVRAGLINGTNNWLWTADASRYDLNQIMRWSSVDTSWTGYYSSFSTWATRTDSYAYRCAYHPIDVDYAGPAGGKCVSGSDCFATAKGGATKIKAWADPFDRTPASYIAAVKACAAEGGHLSTSLDLTELVRDGLPNGSNNWLWTSDAVEGSGQNVLIMKWLGTDAAFDGTYSNYATNSSKVTSTTRPYRCVWSNELR
ncbi:MAG: hypothetical protein AMXMBFR64_62410 [Myxococcales bacterium]